MWIKNVKYVIDNKVIIDDVTCEIKKGRIAVLLGPNGSGKTTLLKLIKGLIKCNEGDIEDNNSVLVLDEPVLYEELTGKEHIEFIAQLVGKKKEIDAKFIKDIVDMLDMKEYLNKVISTYSLGTKKKLQLICALISKPDVVLMDEYISGLDPKILYTVKNVMKEYAKQEKTILLSTHMLDMAEKFCDDVILLNDGKIVKNTLSISEINSKYKDLEQYYLTCVE